MLVFQVQECFYGQYQASYFTIFLSCMYFYHIIIDNSFIPPYEVNLSIIRNDWNKFSAYNILSVGLIVWQNQLVIRVLIKIIILYKNNIFIINLSEVWNYLLWYSRMPIKIIFYFCGTIRYMLQGSTENI